MKEWGEYAEVPFPKHHISLGDSVRVRVEQPFYSWGSVKPHDVGIVECIGFSSESVSRNDSPDHDPIVLINFTSAPTWKGLLSELEIA